MGNCGYCDCRGCANCDSPSAPMSACSVYGDAPPKPGATPDEIGFLETTRGFKKLSGGKYDRPPYLKGQRWRSDHEALAHCMLHAAVAVPVAERQLRRSAADGCKLTRRLRRR